MATDIVMPRLSDSMEEGTILTWMKQVGDEVALGEELVEIETDKANMVFESDAAGTLVEILAGEGDTLPIGEVIARVGDASEAKASGARVVKGEAPTGAAPLSMLRKNLASMLRTPPPTLPPPPPSKKTFRSRHPCRLRRREDGRVKASPVARRMAEEKGVDLSSLQGSGPSGRIIKADVEKAADGWCRRSGGAGSCRRPPRRTAPPSPETAKGAVEVVELTKLQQTVGRRMAESKATAPHFYLQSEIDMTPLLRGARGAEGVGWRGRRDPVVQRHGRQGLCDRAARVPAGQRRLPRRQVGALRARQRRDRRRRARRRSSCRRSSTPTARACARSRPRRGRWPARCATRRSPRPSSPAGRSPSRTSGCTASPTSTR